MKKIVIFLIKKYQKIPGKWHHYCKYQPTCSNYAIGVLNEFGFIKGMYLSIRRIIVMKQQGLQHSLRWMNL